MVLHKQNHKSKGFPSCIMKNPIKTAITLLLAGNELKQRIFLAETKFSLDEVTK